MLFFQLINARHERASTVLTSNKGFEEWGNVARRRGHGGRAHRPVAAPLPHRQHPGQQLPNAGAPGVAPVRGGEAPRGSREMTDSSRSAVAPNPPTLDVANVGDRAACPPVRYVTVWSGRGVDECGAAGALPGAAAGRRAPGPVPPAGRPEVAATAVGRRGADAPGAAGPVPGVAGRVAGIPRRVRDRGSCSSRSATWICRCWRLSSCPGASGVTARPPATSFRLVSTKRSQAPASGRPSMTAGSCSPVRTRPAGRTAAVGRSVPRSCGTADVSTCCARPSLRYGPPGDTPSAPQLRWQLWALRPGLDGASRPSTMLTGRGGPPDSEHAGPDRRGCTSDL